MAIGAGGILGTPFLKSGGFFGFDPTPNSSFVGTARNMANGNFTAAPDNNYHAPQVLGASTSPAATTQDFSIHQGNPNAGGGSGAYVGDGSSTATADQANALFGINTGIQSANDAIGRLDSQQGIGLGNINRDYTDAANRLQGTKQIGERNYNENKTGQLNEYQSARNQSSTAARSFLDNARRVLGTQGAGGGSAARYGVPLEAQQMAATGNAQAQATNNKNIVALDQNWQDEQNKIANSQADLERQKQQGENDLTSKVQSQRADLLNTIATLTGQKTIANGGNYAQALAASQPYTGKIAAILDQINGLSATPAIREQAVQTTAPSLANYDFARPDAPVVAQQDASLSNPVLAGLFGTDPNKRNQYQFA